jgi:hypothetical protein
MPSPTKRCPRCRKALPLDALGVDRSTKGGLATYFRRCSNAYKRTWAVANPEKVAASQRKWRLANRAGTWMGWRANERHAMPQGQLVC